MRNQRDDRKRQVRSGDGICDATQIKSDSIELVIKAMDGEGAS